MRSSGLDPHVLKGHLDLLLLSALDSGPAHGYAIVKEIWQRSEETLRDAEGLRELGLYLDAIVSGGYHEEARPIEAHGRFPPRTWRTELVGIAETNDGPREVVKWSVNTANLFVEQRFASYQDSADRGRS